MKNLYDYFYAVTAACLVGIGTGFLAATDKLIEYDRIAYEAVYALEQDAGVNVNKNTNCSEKSGYMGKCKYAVHLLATNESVIALYDFIYHLLLFVAIICFGLGVGIHYRKAKKL